jgi:hypothetical protein
MIGRMAPNARKLVPYSVDGEGVESNLSIAFKVMFCWHSGYFSSLHTEYWASVLFFCCAIALFDGEGKPSGPMTCKRVL